MFGTCAVAGEAFLSHYYVTGYATGIAAGVVACLCECVVLLHTVRRARVNLSDCVGV